MTSVANHSRRHGLRTHRCVLLLVLAMYPLLGTHAAGPQNSFPKILSLPGGFQPEGIATGRGTDFFVGSLKDGALYKGDLRTGAGSVLAPGEPGRIVAGVKVEVRTNLVFAAGGSTGNAYVFDGTTGVLVETFPLASTTPTFINDVVITRDAAYFTDSFNPAIYKLPLGPGGRLPDPSEVEVLVVTGDFVQVPGFNLNGIAATSNGKALVVVQSATGLLFTADPATGFAEQIDLGGATLPNGDGILLDGKTLYVVQNQLNKIAVIDLDLASRSGVIVREITDPAFRVPTTIAEFGASLYAVNARFGTPPTPTTEYEAVRVER